MQFGVDELEGPCWNHTKHTFALPEKLRVPEAKNTFRREFERSAKIFAKRLGERTYVMGDEFTIADIVIGHSANWGRFCGYDWPEGPASDYVARVRSRPAFSRAWDLREAS